MFEDMVIIWMGEFSCMLNINGNVGCDYFVCVWSVVVGGVGMNSGIVVG